MVNVCPAMFNVPDRPAPVLPATVNVTVPGPMPLVGLIVTQEELFVIDHEQPAAVNTVIVPVVPSGETVMLETERE